MTPLTHSYLKKCAQEGREAGMSTAAGSADDRALRGVCPVDLIPWDPVPSTTPEEVGGVVENAREAAEEWARRSLSDRQKCLERAARNLLDDRGRIVDLVRTEMGKLEVDALFSEGLGPLEVLRGWGRVVDRALSRERVRLNPLSFPRKKAYIDLKPRGVIGIIAPWNFPVAGLYRSVYPALLTGNGVVVKPSEYTPRASGWFLEHLQAVLPDGLVGLVQGAGDTGAALVRSGVDAVVFTGSAATGKKVGVAAAEVGIPSSLEMGGNDAAIVLEDANLERTAAGLTQWSLQNSGQACGAIEIAYLDRRIADRLVARLARAFSTLRVAPGPMAEVDISPVAHVAQLERIEAHVEDARAKGAEIVTGGRRTGHGLGYEPTLIDHATDEMEVVREETFGPVLALCRVDGPTEAIRRINRGRYGLTTSFWTRDPARAERLADRVSCGVVTINNHALTGAIPELPWTGTKDSGFGVAGSRHALATFTRPRALLVDQASDPEPFWLPYDRSAWRLADLLADAQLLRLERAWRLPLLLRERVRTVKDYFRT